MSRSSPTSRCDVVSLSFEKAWRGLDQLGERDGDRFRPWVFRIATNELASMMRSLSRRTEGEHVATVTGVMADQRTDRFERVDARIDDASVLSVLGRLPDRYQEVISLRYLSDLTAAETAKSLGISRGNVAVLLHRALAALRREIGDER
jgi:RNA polymerase sigma-70 factor (ECF subfamily)